MEAGRFLGAEGLTCLADLIIVDQHLEIERVHDPVANIVDRRQLRDSPYHGGSELFTVDSWIRRLNGLRYLPSHLTMVDLVEAPNNGLDEVVGSFNVLLKSCQKRVIWPVRFACRDPIPCF